MLSEDEMAIYKRQLQIDGWGKEKQIKLKNSTVFVAGAGGLGSPVLYYLTAAGIGTIRICDFDSIELSNLNRQILHSMDRVGALKVDSAFDRLRALNDKTDIIKFSEPLTDRNVEFLTEGADLIIDCLDNFGARHVLNKISVKKRIPMIHAGIAEFQGHLTFIMPPETPCLACSFDEDRAPENLNVIGATAGMIGALQATEALKYLTGIGENIKGKLVIYDGSTMSFDSLALFKNPECAVCGIS
jgi:adenylyltransferase/sulfurtransferase